MINYPNARRRHTHKQGLINIVWYFVNINYETKQQVVSGISLLKKYAAKSILLLF